MEDSQIVFHFGVCQKSAKFRKSQEVYVLREVAKLLRGFDIKMVGAWGFEPQTPTVSRRLSTASEEDQACCAYNGVRTVRIVRALIGH